MYPIIGIPDDGSFLQRARGYALELVTRTQMESNHSVLDLGCGCGRLALPLAEYLSGGGHYLGIDVWPEGIQWCVENITSRHPHTEFRCLESSDNYYYSESRTGSENNYRMPFVVSESVDVVFAGSTFTHLTLKDATTYLHEIGRILKPTGLAFLTFFLIDRHFFAYREQFPGRHAGVKLAEDGAYYAYAKHQFFAGFTPETLRRMADEAGLEIVTYETGVWANKPGSRLYQDTVIFTPKER